MGKPEQGSLMTQQFLKVTYKKRNYYKSQVFELGTGGHIEELLRGMSKSYFCPWLWLQVCLPHNNPLTSIRVLWGFWVCFVLG